MSLAKGDESKETEKQNTEGANESKALGLESNSVSGDEITSKIPELVSTPKPSTITKTFSRKHKESKEATSGLQAPDPRLEALSSKFDALSTLLMDMMNKLETKMQEKMDAQNEKFTSAIDRNTDALAFMIENLVESGFVKVPTKDASTQTDNSTKGEKEENDKLVGQNEEVQGGVSSAGDAERRMVVFHAVNAEASIAVSQVDSTIKEVDNMQAEATVNSHIDSMQIDVGVEGEPLEKLVISKEAKDYNKQAWCHQGIEKIYLYQGANY